MVSRGTEPAPLASEDYLLLAAVLLLPWAFGGVDIWAHRSAALLLVASACVCLWKRGWAGWGLFRGCRWLLPALLLAGWGGVQLIPLPPGAIRVASPEAYRLYAAALPGFDEAVEAPLAALEREALRRVPEAELHPEPAGGGPAVALEAPDCLRERRQTLSVEPTATQERLAWYVALLLGFLVVRERVADRERRRLYLWALLGLGAALALFALIQMQWWNGKIYWVRRLLSQARPFGPYFNPTNLAGVMEMTLPALVGLAWSKLRRRGRAAVYEPGFLVASVSAVVCLVAVFASASKMAAVLAPLGLFVLGLAAARTARTRLLLVGAGLLLALTASFLLAGTRLGERATTFVGRSDEAQLLEGRLAAWNAALEMVRDFPVTGAGFGTFRQAFQRYVPAGAPFRWAHAHNDYLELLLDGGLVAAGLVVWLAWGFGRRALGGLYRREGQLSLVRLGQLIGVATLCLHALIDFNHQIPANALIWVSLCAMLVPAVAEQRGRGSA